MIQTLSWEQLENVVSSIAQEWKINASLNEAGFQKYLPKVEYPQSGVISFPKRTPYFLLLLRLIQEGYSLGNRLVNINEKIIAALSINDVDVAEKQKKYYCDILDILSSEVLKGGALEYDMRNTLLFFLYHELTHVRIAQQPSFYEDKKKELSKRIDSNGIIRRRIMKRCLKDNKSLEEEIVCDLEACKKLKEANFNSVVLKGTLLDIVHSLNMTNCVSNLRPNYKNAKRSMLLTYYELTHSENTKTSISRFIFIQNFWNDVVILNGKELWSDIISTAHSLGFTQDTLDFCKQEYKKGEDKEGSVNLDKKRVKEIRYDICSKETDFFDSIISQK